ncbi:MAG: hypothetical protein ACC635_04540 [Acidiferrobacterales bacterium]
MIKFLKLSIVLPAMLLAGCQQQSRDCEIPRQKILLLEQQLAASSQAGNLPKKVYDVRLAKQQQQLVEVTQELVLVKVERDKLKQELKALRKAITRN